MRVFTALFFAILLYGSCQQKLLHPEIVIQGSETEFELTSSLSKAYMNRSQQKISVSGGGSGNGISNLIKNKIDIANASRPFSTEEIKTARANSVEPVPVIFAIDALAIISNDALPVRVLSMQQLSDIFSGKITSWKGLGGPDRPIKVFGRRKGSGTFRYVQETVVQGEYSKQMNQLSNNTEILESVKRTPFSIGYVGLGHALDEHRNVLSGLQILQISASDGSVSSPVYSSDIQSEKYPLIRPLYQYLNGQPNGKTSDFIQFILSREGQQIVAKSGYYPISPSYQVMNNQRVQLAYSK